MHKNWKAICETGNTWLRMLAATTTDPAMLAALEKGFPHLFSETEVLLKVPYTAYLAACAQFAKGDSVVLMDNVLEYYGIPDFKWGSPHSGGEMGTLVPVAWREIILPENNSRRGYDPLLNPTPIFLDWNGEQCLLVEFSDFDPETGECDWLTVIPARFIDFDA